MFGRKKIRELEDKVLELDAKLSIVEGLLEVSQEVIKKNQRRCAEQAKDFEDKLITLKRNIAELENSVADLLKKENAQSSLGQTEDKKEASYSQVMDEWLNGKRAGDK